MMEGEDDVGKNRWQNITDIVVKAAEESWGIDDKKMDNPWIIGKEKEIKPQEKGLQ